MNIKDKVLSVIQSSIPQNKSIQSGTESKSFFGGWWPGNWLGWLPGWLGSNGSSNAYQLTAWQSVQYYNAVAPIYIAINLIAEHVKSINPIIVNKQTGEPIENHPIELLFKSPNADATWEELIYRAASFYLITGNTYVLAGGQVNKPPKEIYIVPSQNVILQTDEFGFTNRMNVQGSGHLAQFERKEIKGRFRYYDGPMRELYHIRTFNPSPLGIIQYGMSPLRPLMAEIEQYISASEHNLSLLKRGAKIPLVMSFHDPLDSDNLTRIQQQLDSFYSGAGNAGRSMVTDGKVDIKEVATSNRDMDFYNLKRSLEHAIYNALKVPLPLVSAEQMTYSNMETSMLNFYDNAVLPLVKTLYRELTLLLMPRYGTENLEITFDENTITALDIRRETKIKSRRDMDIFTIDELRRMSGSKSLGEGASAIYRPNSLFPVAYDKDDVQPTEEIDDTLPKRFKSLLRAKTSKELID